MTGTIDARPARPVREERPLVGDRPAGEHSVGELVHQATEQISLLIRQEAALAKEELTAKGRSMGRGGGLLGAAGAVAYVGLFALAGTGVAALSLVLPVWAAALIVTGVLFAIAGLLALTGRAQLHRAGPPTPQQTIGSVKADVEEIKERAHHR
ncbi:MULTISPECIES: phage holin family protein [Streptomyces]|uniref:phage holin family protein n=1 Tax=Streptomyces TaxID=1883 RepID=UPI0001D05BC2|nr:integral membrane protein [Streptomyces sp. e14]MBY8866028.1 phage holin family protein [Streptomyces sennicomposti]MYS45125.1 phage holin family protein [Streptomyces sp. SID5998]MYX31274.1 phage holin family protein [Streptomyces sp. SID8381]MYX45918.1 phage holin family protein [Streptomyces sp. SID89]NED37245.1 phage holin family protein [Streptomyces sp. SID8499]